jgi:hypothetical protein
MIHNIRYGSFWAITLSCLSVHYVNKLDCFNLGAKRENYSDTIDAAPSYVQTGNNATEYDILVRIMNYNQIKISP